MDLASRSLEVAVKPCQEATFQVSALTKAEKTEVVSQKSKSGFKTFQAPKAKENLTDITHEYHIDSDDMVDLTKLDLSLNFEDVLEDSSCHKVAGAELR